MSTILETAKSEIKQRIKEIGFEYSLYGKYNVEVCNLCGARKEIWLLYSHQDRYGLPVRSMQCSDCGLIFITPRMYQGAYDYFYDRWYRKLVGAFNGRIPSEEESEYSRQMQSDEMVKFLGEHLPNDLTIKQVLDIGGSTGVFAEKVCGVTGATGVVIDPNPHEIREASKKSLTVSVSSFEDYKTDKKFELISMLRTVEHLQDVQGSLAKVKGMLTVDGVFLIDIVNHEWLIRHFKSKCLATKIDHIYQLTDKTLRLYLDKAGFKIIGNSDVGGRYVSYLASVKW